MLTINIKKDIIQDAINLKNGVYAPLSGFLKRQDYISVLDNMRLKSGEVWSIPIIVSINEDKHNY